MIKYINIYPADNRISEKHPTHKLAITHENGDKQYIGAIWIKENGIGSVQLEDGVTFTGLENVKVYPPKNIAPTSSSPSVATPIATPITTPEVTIDALQNELPKANPDDIPF